MYRATLVVAFLIALFFAVPVALRVQAWVGSPVVAICAIAFVLMAAWLGHTSESEAMAEDFRAALRDVGISQKEAAITMGVTQSVLTEWLNGTEPGAFNRIAMLGPKFRVAFAKRLIARDSDAAVVERQEICELVNAVQSLTAEMRRPQSSMEVARCA